MDECKPLDFGQLGHPVRGLSSRSSTSYLTPHMLANYTFFTFVRDPKTRFRSSYEQVGTLTLS